MVKVIALDTYEKRNIKDDVLKRIPKEGETFEVTEERLSVLLGDNKYQCAFVRIDEEAPKADAEDKEDETADNTADELQTPADNADEENENKDETFDDENKTEEEVEEDKKKKTTKK